MGGINIVEAALNVEEEGGNFDVQLLEEADFMGECCSGVKGGEAREGASLMGVEEAAGPCEEGEARGKDPFHTSHLWGNEHSYIHKLENFHVLFFHVINSLVITSMALLLVNLTSPYLFCFILFSSFPLLPRPFFLLHFSSP